MLFISLCFLVGFSIGRILGCYTAKKQFYRPLLHDHCAVCQCRLVEAFGVKVPECEAKLLLAPQASEEADAPEIINQAGKTRPPSGDGFERVRPANEHEPRNQVRRRMAA